MAVPGDIEDELMMLGRELLVVLIDDLAGERLDADEAVAARCPVSELVAGGT
jgi:hypothetical protein